LFRRILYFLILAAVCAGSAIWWIQRELLAPYYGAQEPETFIEISPDTSSGSIATQLAKARVLRRRWPFLIYARITSSSRRLQAGEYRFATPESPVQILARLVRGDVYFQSVTIPEGLDNREVIERLIKSRLGRQADFERALAKTEWIRDLAPSARNLEGFLFPDTYRFGRKALPEEILKTMVDQFRLRWGKLLVDHPLPQGWDVTRIVTLASIVEKEAGNAEERSLVASVMVNRLRRGIPLAVDPTIIYALKLSRKFDGNLRKSDMSLNSPYNTYLHGGLPPGPIANPGLNSLLAALAPARSNYLYYVSKNDGTHQFSKDYQSHLNAVAKYQRAPIRRPPAKR
jgi:UPF0755 protein